MKTCTKCHTEKALDDFHKSKNTKDGRQSYCKLCNKLIGSIYRRTHPESSRASTNRYRAKYPDRVKLCGDQYRQSHREELCLKQREYTKRFGRKPWSGSKAAHKRYYQANKEKYLNYTARRRAWKTNQSLPHERVSRKEIFKRDNFICHLCKKKVKTEQLSIDHLIPLSQGGQHTYGNLATAHLLCNQRRGVNHRPAQLRLFG